MVVLMLRLLSGDKKFIDLEKNFLLKMFHIPPTHIPSKQNNPLGVVFKILSVDKIYSIGIL